MYRFLLAGVAALTVAACESPTHLHVHSGPMADANPNLVIPYGSSGQGNTGTIWFTYPENTACNGKWERITKRVSEGLFRDSGDVTWHGGITGMGEGNEVLHTGGKAQIVGAGDCTDGTSFVFFSVSNGYKSRGGLKDSHGNMFVMMRR